MSDHIYEIDLFKPSDAAGVAQLFRGVYGDEYPVKVVYNPEQLVTAFQNGEYIPVLARTSDNRIVGYTALYRSTPYTGLYEVGQTLVSLDYRNTPVAGLLFRHTMRVAPKLSGINALFCEAVCNHTLVQRAGIIFRYVEAAIEIDLMPSEAYERENTASGRVSTLDMFKTLVQKPHVIYLSEDYEDCLRYIYEGFDDSRTLLSSTDSLPLHGSTEITTQIFDFAQLARVTVSAIGMDFETVFDTEEKSIMDKHCTIIQVWLKLSWPWIGRVIDVLRNRRFFLGGALPRWFGEDGLLMQKVIGQPNWEGINLYADRAVHILRFIKDDWERTQIGDPF